jgi:hypothetical protein
VGRAIPEYRNTAVLGSSMPKIPVLGKDPVLPSLIARFHVKIILLLNGINAHRAEHTVREYSVYFDYLLCFIWSLDSLLRCCLLSVSNEMAHSMYTVSSSPNWGEGKKLLGFIQIGQTICREVGGA